MVSRGAPSGLGDRGDAGTRQTPGFHPGLRRGVPLAPFVTKGISWAPWHLFPLCAWLWQLRPCVHLCLAHPPASRIGRGSGRGCAGSALGAWGRQLGHGARFAAATLVPLGSRPKKEPPAREALLKDFAIEPQWASGEATTTKQEAHHANAQQQGTSWLGNRRQTC